MRYLSAAFPPAFFLVIGRHPLSVCRRARFASSRSHTHTLIYALYTIAHSRDARTDSHAQRARRGHHHHRRVHPRYYVLCLRNWLNAYEWAHADVVTGNLTYFWTFYEARRLEKEKAERT